MLHLEQVRVSLLISQCLVRLKMLHCRSWLNMLNDVGLRRLVRSIEHLDSKTSALAEASKASHSWDVSGPGPGWKQRDLATAEVATCETAGVSCAFTYSELRT